MQVPRIGRLLANSALGCGLVIFVLGPSEGAHARHVQVLYAFKGGDDGAYPLSEVISDKAGNLYGTTGGGGGSGCNGYGCGAVFRIAPDGTETVLYAFKGGSDGIVPWGKLVRDKQGNLFGTTQQGGGSGCDGYGCGTVFKLTPRGTETVLHAFQGGSDGVGPVGGLVSDPQGNLYGTTYQGGGTGCSGYGCGIVFEVAPDGSETVLHAFCIQDTWNCADGSSPAPTLVMDKEGSLYGTTVGGGPFGGGTVFKIEGDGIETTLYGFCAAPSCSDGLNPLAGVALDNQGNLYGSTDAGGTAYEGVVFKLAPSGIETVLHSFDLQVDGASPDTGVSLGRNGSVYGTLTWGGFADCEGGEQNGAVFQLSPDGREKESCIPVTLFSGVTKQGSRLLGANEFSDMYKYGAIVSLLKGPLASQPHDR